MGQTSKAARIEDDVLSEEEIAAAAAAADALENLEEEDVEAAVVEAEKSDAKKKGYEKTKSKTKGKTSKKATPKKAAKKDAAAPRMSLDTHKASEIITTRLGADAHTQFTLITTKKPRADIQKKNMASTLTVIDTLDKKTREKAVNLFTSLAAGKKPSVYTVSALGFLKKAGQFTQKELTDHFLGMGYKIGTARRQAGEMVSLFPVVGIASREAERGSPVVFNTASDIAARILAL